MIRSAPHHSDIAAVNNHQSIHIQNTASERIDHIRRPIHSTYYAARLAGPAADVNDTVANCDRCRPHGTFFSTKLYPCDTESLSSMNLFGSGINHVNTARICCRKPERRSVALSYAK